MDNPTLGVIRSIREGHRGREKTPTQWGSIDALRDVDLRLLTRTSLRKHLQARNLDTNGTKVELVERLMASVSDELSGGKELKKKGEQELLVLQELEERGAVYAIGKNRNGQLGVGDTDDRDAFTLVEASRGLGIRQVAANHDVVFALTEDKDIYAWGGWGKGPMANGRSLACQERSTFDPAMEHFLVPQMVKTMQGEEIVEVSVGANHVLARSSGGDIFVWGQNPCGQLGVGDFKSRLKPELLTCNISNGTSFVQVAAGEDHSLAVTAKGELYTWGTAYGGRLGLGTCTREGEIEKHKKGFFPVPSLVLEFRKMMVKRVACGPAHCLALVDGVLFSWGEGDGGKLGLGDLKDRIKPTPVQYFENQLIHDFSCGTWHSAAIVLVPPLHNGGYLYTWGSGFCGQLGHGLEERTQTIPTLCETFVQLHLPVKEIFCGEFHTVAITLDGEMYSWGSNQHYCLGRDLDPGTEQAHQFSSYPGHVSGFGTIVGTVGRGLVRSVAVGRHFTIVSTYPYEGPIYSIATRLMEEHAIHMSEMEQSDDENEEEEIDREMLDNVNRLQEGLSLSQSASLLCSKCDDCPGYAFDVHHPLLCLECGHKKEYHNVVDHDGDSSTDDPTPTILEKNM